MSYKVKLSKITLSFNGLRLFLEETLHLSTSLIEITFFFSSSYEIKYLNLIHNNDRFIILT